ncbi:SCO family protein [Marinobacter sp.]|uniref:SCO family protein n=1 Tax=Marinobacter sp. TaxID=50741 RepID=UPI00384CA44B
MINRFRASRPLRFSLFALALGLGFSLPVLPGLLKSDDFYGFQQDRSVWQNLKNYGSLASRDDVYTFVMFGFLDCEQTCPAHLGNMVSLNRLIPDDSVQFLFVSVDPENDTPQELDAVIGAMGERFHWHRPETRSHAQMMALEAGEVVSVAATADIKEIDHSGRLYLVGRGGKSVITYTSTRLKLNRVKDDVSRLVALESGS